MGYFAKLFPKAFRETWQLVVCSPGRVVGIAILITVLSAAFSNRLFGSEEMTSLLHAALVTLAVMTISFLAAFSFNFFVLTPKHIYLEAQETIKTRDQTLDAWRLAFDPKIILECDSNVFGSPQSTMPSWDFDETFRVVIKSLGFNSVQSCSGRLLEISKDGSLIFAGEELPLTFFSMGNIYETNKRLDPNLPSYLEVFGIKDGRLKVALNKHGRSLGDKIDAEIQKHGLYKVKIAVISNQSVTIGATLKWKWEGSFATSSLSLVEQHSLARMPSTTLDNA